MKEEDLIRELENLETPDIDLPGHRQSLKAALINSDRFRRRTPMGWARILAPVAAAVALMAFFGFVNLIQPELHTARAMEIARTDAQVRALMTDYGLDIAEVKLQDGEAFVLLAPRLVRDVTHEMADEQKTADDRASYSRVSPILSRLFGWMLPSSTDEGGTHNAPPAEDFPSGEEGRLHYYVIKVDLAEKTVSGFLEIDYAVVLRDIDLAEAHFAESALPEDVAGEEPDPDM
ncbi:MAG: hypothetical protein R6V51_03020 [Dehalococcoidia bacterium]